MCTIAMGPRTFFAGDDRVLLCSTFQHPFYPHTGYDCKSANVVNVPLPAGPIAWRFARPSSNTGCRDLRLSPPVDRNFRRV